MAKRKFPLFIIDTNRLQLNEANYHRLNTGDYIERKTVLTSMLMLDQAAKYIEKTYGDK